MYSYLNLTFYTVTEEDGVSKENLRQHVMSSKVMIRKLICFVERNKNENLNK